MINDKVNLLVNNCKQFTLNHGSFEHLNQINRVLQSLITIFHLILKVNRSTLREN